MIIKAIKSASAANTLRYVLDKKGAQLLSSEGVRTYDTAFIIEDFKAVIAEGPAIKHPVMHLAVSFHRQDKDLLEEEDMKKMAKQILQEMGFRNTPFVVVRHTDQPHPHFHIVASRIDHQGKRISDAHSYVTLRKVRQAIEADYPRLTPARGRNSNSINAGRLRGGDQLKHQLYISISSVLQQSRTMDSFIEKLKEQGIEVQLKYKRGTVDVVEGIKFGRNNVWFSGSKIDKSLSYLHICRTLLQNKVGKAGAVKSGKVRSAGAVGGRDYRTKDSSSYGTGTVYNNTVFDDPYALDKPKRRAL